MAKPEAFVIMPYKEPYEGIYANAINAALKQCGFESIRADEVKRSTPFSADIETDIRSADLVVAETSAGNLNVYYELGIAKALNKEVILLSHDVSSAPSDTRHIRHLTYELTDVNGLRQKFKDWGLLRGQA